VRTSVAKDATSALSALDDGHAWLLGLVMVDPLSVFDSEKRSENRRTTVFLCPDPPRSSQLEIFLALH